MVRKPSFPRETVLDAAFAILREEGWRGVSARAISRRLRSSTMPIYSSIGSMEALEAELRRRAQGALQDYQLRSYTGNAVFDLALGYVAFAREERELFRFLYVDAPGQAFEPDLGAQAIEGLMERSPAGPGGLREMMASMPGLMDNPFLLKNWIFVHGLASLVSSGALHLTDERVRDLLAEAASAFLLQQQAQPKGEPQ